MAGEEATTEVLVPMVAIICSCSRRSPVRGAEWANQLPIYLRGLAMLAAGAVLMPGVQAQAPPDGGAPPAVVRQAGKLVLHQPVERELAPGQTDVFTVEVAAGQFLHVEAEKKGVDVVRVRADPQGKPLVTADSPNNAFGPEPASLIAEGSGEYQIRVAKSPRTSETGRYRIELTDLHAPTEQDRTRLQAETEFFAAVANNRAQERERRLQAIAGYQRAAALWRSLHDDGEAALCLHRIGLIYSNLGEEQKALDYHNQALPLRRAAGDRAGEAATLNNIGNVYADLGENQKALDYYSQALTLGRAAGDRAGEAGTLNNIGGVYLDLGGKQKALDYNNQALQPWRAGTARARRRRWATSALSIWILGRSRRRWTTTTKRCRYCGRWGTARARRRRWATSAASIAVLGRSRRRWTTATWRCRWSGRWGTARRRRVRCTTSARCMRILGRSRRLWTITTRRCRCNVRWGTARARRKR